jgi:hypothetical protein
MAGAQSGALSCGHRTPAVVMLMKLAESLTVDERDALAHALAPEE